MGFVKYEGVKTFHRCRNWPTFVTLMTDGRASFGVVTTDRFGLRNKKSVDLYWDSQNNSLGFVFRRDKQGHFMVIRNGNSGVIVSIHAFCRTHKIPIPQYKLGLHVQTFDDNEMLTCKVEVES